MIKKTYLILLLTVIISHAGLCEESPQLLIKYHKTRIRDFSSEDKLSGWWVDENGNNLETVNAEKLDKKTPALIVPVDFPSSKSIWLDKLVTLLKYDYTLKNKPVFIAKISIEIFLPIGAIGRNQCALLLKDKDGIFYKQTSKDLLIPGKWNTINFNLLTGISNIEPKGHNSAFSLQHLLNIEKIGFLVWSNKSFDGNIFIDNISTHEIDTIHYPDKLKCFFVNRPLHKISKLGKYELSFDINRFYINPFNCSEVTTDACFTCKATGKEYTVPAFYFQNYVRVDDKDKYKYIPTGKPYFKVRFTPPESGEYSLIFKTKFTNLFANNSEENEEAFMHTFFVDENLDQGFIRVSAKDKNYFEFDNGDFFYPVGHNFRSPWDMRDWGKILKPVVKNARKPVDKGFKKYEEILPKMSKSGENLIEVWMSSWWLALEWTSRWKGYHGLLNYNTENAWKLDQLLDLCHKNNIYLQLVLDNHGKAAVAPQVDAEWQFNPYNAVENPEGFLKNPQELFNNQHAKELYKNLYRYIAARYGYSKNIFSFELWSELDLTGNKAGRHRNVYATDNVRNWHKEMSNFLRKFDHSKHLITTHYSGFYNYVDRKMAAMPEIDFVVCDAYHAPKQTLVDMLVKTDRFMKAFNKPYIVTEFGGNWNAATWQELEADLHSGLWSSLILGAGGTPLFWWFEHIDRAKLYFHFKAFSKFIRKEDFRKDKKHKSTNIQVKVLHESTVKQENAEGSGKKAKPEVSAMAAMFNDKVICWIYSHESLKKIDKKHKKKKYSGYSVKIMDMPEGDYIYEIWDTWKGRIIKKENIKITTNGAIICLPEFKFDIAVKLITR